MYFQRTITRHFSSKFIWKRRYWIDTKKSANMVAIWLSQGSIDKCVLQPRETEDLWPRCRLHHWAHHEILFWLAHPNQCILIGIAVYFYSVGDSRLNKKNDSWISTGLSARNGGQAPTRKHIKKNQTPSNSFQCVTGSNTDHFPSANILNIIIIIIIIMADSIGCGTLLYIRSSMSIGAENRWTRMTIRYRIWIVRAVISI